MADSGEGLHAAQETLVGLVKAALGGACSCRLCLREHAFGQYDASPVDGCLFSKELLDSRLATFGDADFDRGLCDARLNAMAGEQLFLADNAIRDALDCELQEVGIGSWIPLD